VYVNRREFLEKSAKAAAVGVIASAIPASVKGALKDHPVQLLMH
jgi:hypothetical protein